MSTALRTQRPTGLPAAPTPEEEREWFAVFHDLSAPVTRRQEARGRLIAGNMGLVWSAVFGSKTHPRYHEDLASFLTIQLIACVDMFDPSRGLRFSTYALSCLNARTIHYPRLHESLIHIPAWVASPCKSLPVPKRYARAAEAAYRPASTSCPAVAAEAHSRHRADDAPWPDEEGRLPPAVAAEVEALPELQREVVLSYHGVGRDRRTYREIGLAAGISYQRAKEVHDRAVATIRRRLTNADSPPAPPPPPKPRGRRMPRPGAAYFRGAERFTPGMVAAACGETVAAVRWWIDSGELPVTTPPYSRTPMVARAAVADLLAARGLPPLPEPAAGAAS